MSKGSWECVYVESPYNGTPEEIERNIQYAIAAMRDCLKRKEAPFLSHLIYTQSPKVGFVSDDDEKFKFIGREAAIEAALCWAAKSEKTVVYTDLGMSKGMKIGIENAEKVGRKVEYRSLPEWNKLVAN